MIAKISNNNFNKRIVIEVVKTISKFKKTKNKI